MQVAKGGKRVVVYWDSVLLFNGLCDYLLLLCTVRLAGRSPVRRHLFFASVLGAAYALLVCLYPLGIYAAPLFLAAMGWIAFHKSGSVGKLTLLFALLSCLLAGLLLLLGTAFASDIQNVSLGALPWHIFAIGFVVSYVLLCVLFRGGLQKTGKDLTKATFYHHGKRVDLRLLCDSGNLLRDENGGCVPIVEEAALAPLGIVSEEFCEIPCRTVGGDAALHAFVCESIVIGGKRKEHCMVAVTPQKIGGIYAGLWGETCMEEDPCVAL